MNNKRKYKNNNKNKTKGGTQFSTQLDEVCGMYSQYGCPLTCNTIGEIASSVATGSRITSGGGSFIYFYLFYFILFYLFIDIFSCFYYFFVFIINFFIYLILIFYFNRII